MKLHCGGSALQAELGSGVIQGLAALLYTGGNAIGLLEDGGGEDHHVGVALHNGIHVVPAQTAVHSQLAGGVLLVDLRTGPLDEVDGRFYFSCRRRQRY